MQENIRKTADDADYTIKREFLGEITVEELIEQIIRSHLFPSSCHTAAPSQTENVPQIRKPNEDEGF